MQQGEIWLVRLPPPPGDTGREQAGTRPALIAQSSPDDPPSPMVVVIPITSKQAALRFPHTLKVEPSSQNGLTMASVLLVFQIRALDKRRFLRQLGALEQERLAEATSMLRELLGL